MISRASAVYPIAVLGCLSFSPPTNICSSRFVMLILPSVINVGPPPIAVTILHLLQSYLLSLLIVGIGSFPFAITGESSNAYTYFIAESVNVQATSAFLFLLMAMALRVG